MDLSRKHVEQFIADGYVRVEQAFSRQLADECREILWADMDCDPGDPSTWQQPVVWLGGYAQTPFLQAANTPRLHRAFDQLVGEGNWRPCRGLGSFPVRFPTSEDTGDTGWHVDASFAGKDSDPNDVLSYHINVYSRDRALLMLFLFSDVGEQNAPTRLRVGSHRAVAQMLEPAGEEGLSFLELSARLGATADCPEAIATGEAGTVYLCHPFLVHAAQINRGSQPRLMAQPPLLPVKPFELTGKESSSYLPVEQAIRSALEKA